MKLSELIREEFSTDVDSIDRVIGAITARLHECVKPLEWDDFPKDDGPVFSKAITSFGTYFICDDNDDMSGLYLEIISHDNARWWQNVSATCDILMSCVHDDNLTKLKAAAQAHYAARITEGLDL